MNRTIQRVAPLECLLAGTLYYGTLMASVVVCVGLGLAMIDSRFGAPRLAISRDMRIATIGIALFILLPVARVIVMLVAPEVAQFSVLTSPGAIVEFKRRCARALAALACQAT